MSVKKNFFTIVNQAESVTDQTLVILGTALDGPARVPFQITSPEDYFSLLGRAPLTNAYNQARLSGATDIILYRLNGTHATGLATYDEVDPVTSDVTEIDVLRFTSVSASDIYNDIMISFSGTEASVYSSDGSLRVYKYIEYKDAYSFAAALNRDAEYGLIEFKAEALVPEFKMSRFGETLFTVLFSGGSSEADLITDRLNNDITAVPELISRVKQALFGDIVTDQEVYEPSGELGYINFQVITVADLYHEDDPELAKIIGNFCLNKATGHTLGCLGVIGVRPIYDITEAKVKAKAAELLTLAPSKLKSPGLPGEDYSESVLIEQIDYTSHVQIVTGQTQLTSIFSGDTPQPVSLAYIYAATQAINPYYVSMTNKTLTGISRPSYEFKKKDLEDLSANGYISIVSSIRRGYVPYYSTTAVGTKNESRFCNPHHIRIVHYITKLMIDSLDDFIGLNNNPLSRGAIATKARGVMESLLAEGSIRDYDLEFESPSRTDIRVKVYFTPFSEVKAISTIISLPFGEGVV